MIVNMFVTAQIDPEIRQVKAKNVSSQRCKWSFLTLKWRTSAVSWVVTYVFLYIK